MGWLKEAFGFITGAWKAWRSSISVERGLHEEQLEIMRRKRALEDSVEYREPFFFKEGDEQPACPTCWQKDTMFVYLKIEERSGDGERNFRQCPVCGCYVHTTARRPPLGSGGGVPFSRR